MNAELEPAITRIADVVSEVCSTTVAPLRPLWSANRFGSFGGSAGGFHCLVTPFARCPFCELRAANTCGGESMFSTATGPEADVDGE